MCALSSLRRKRGTVYGYLLFILSAHWRAWQLVQLTWHSVFLPPRWQEVGLGYEGLSWSLNLDSVSVRTLDSVSRITEMVKTSLLIACTSMNACVP